MTISVGGEIGEVGKSNSTEEELRAYLDGYLAAVGDGHRADQQGEHPDRDQPRRRADAGRQRGRGQHRLRHAAAALDGRARRVRDGRLRPARRIDPAGGGLPPLPGQRHRRDPPRHRLPEHPLRRRRPAGRPARRDDGLVPRQLPPTSARTARPTSSSCTRRARRRSGRSSGSSGRSRRRAPQTRSAPTCARSSASSSTSSASRGTRELVERFVTPRPRGAAAAGRPRRRRRRGPSRPAHRSSRTTAPASSRRRRRVLSEADELLSTGWSARPMSRRAAEGGSFASASTARSRSSAPSSPTRPQSRSAVSGVEPVEDGEDALDGPRVAAHERSRRPGRTDSTKSSRPASRSPRRASSGSAPAPVASRASADAALDDRQHRVRLALACEPIATRRNHSQ